MRQVIKTKKLRIVLFIILFLNLIFLFSCSREIVDTTLELPMVEITKEEAFSGKLSDETLQKVYESIAKEKKEAEIAQIYCIALDSLIPVDENLNNDMKYIAIDANRTEISTEKQKEILRDYFSKYRVPVVFTSYKSLKEKGKVIEDSYIEGILLSVEKTEISNNNAIIECSKYKSNLSAIGIKCELEFREDNWIVKYIRILWES